MSSTSLTYADSATEARPSAVDAVAEQSAEAARRWFLPDLVLVATFLILVVAAAVSAVRQVQHQRAIAQLGRELLASAQAIRTYQQEKGAPPAGSAAGVMPDGLAAYLPNVDWTAPTPVGGTYRWVNTATGKPSPAGLTGRIILQAYPPADSLQLTGADLLELDRVIDDGNLATGNFRTGFNGWPVLLVPPAP